VKTNQLKKCPEDVRRNALERMKCSNNITALAKEIELSRSVLYKWKRQEEAGEAGGIPVRNLQKKIQELERVLAEKTVEADFFKGALQKIEARRQRSTNSGGTASTTKSGR
jgi:transposase-like protein